MSSPKSDHGAKPAHKPHESASEPKDALRTIDTSTPSAKDVTVESSGLADSADLKQTVQEPAPKGQSLVYPVALAVLAVFPLAIGIGIARVRAIANEAAAQSVWENPTDELPADQTTTAQRPADRGYGDRQFLERRYEVALQYYQSLGSTDSHRLPPELLYRIGLCQEGLGLWLEALESLNVVSETTDNLQLKAAADFGLFRIFVRLNEKEKALAKLISLQFHSDADVLPANMAHEIRFLIPLTLGFELTSGESDGQNLEPIQMSEFFVWASETSLAWVNTRKPTNSPSLQDSVADAVSPANQFPCQVRRTLGIANNAAPIEQFTVTARSDRRTIREVLERVSNECHWQLDWTSVGNDAALERMTFFQIENMPVTLLVTSLCAESNLTWSLEQDRLSVIPADAGASRRMIARTLENLIADNSVHRFVEHSRFVLGRIAEFERDFAGAAQLYASMTGRNSSPLAIRAAYYAGLNFLKAGDSNRACSQFGYVVKGAPGHEYHILSLLKYGQLLLERGDFSTAANQFRRATEARKYPECQAIAAAYLGMTLVMQEKYQEAAEAVLAHRFQFEDGPVRNAAALVTSLARWKATTGELQEREAAFMYRTLVAVSEETDWFGHTGQLLIGRLYLELGFDDQLVEHYQAQLAKGTPEHIATEMKYSLAQVDYSHDRRETALQTWKELSEKPVGVWSNRARLRLAEVALSEGHASECVDLCRSIRNRDGVERKVLLKVMGRAFEQLGEDVLAARCFAGQLPKE